MVVGDELNLNPAVRSCRESYLPLTGAGFKRYRRGCTGVLGTKVQVEWWSRADGTKVGGALTTEARRHRGGSGVHLKIISICHNPLIGMLTKSESIFPLQFP